LSETRFGTERVIRFEDSSFIRLSNSKITGTGMSDVAAYQMGMLVGSHGIEILNNEIFNVSGYAIYAPVVDSLIEGNYIHDTGGYGIHHFYSSCTTCSHNNIIRNNTIVRHGRLTGDAGRPGCGMVTSSGNNNQVYNNLILGDASTGCGIQIFGSCVGCKIWYNTMVGNAGNCIQNESGFGTTIQDNICWNNGGNITNGDAGATIDHNTTNAANPNFVNAGAGDYHVQPGPARNAGVRITAVATDLCGVSRPQESADDIGAYEGSACTGAIVLPPPTGLRVISTTTP
jgi:Right handed beta helix region